MWTKAGELGGEKLVEHIRNLKPELKQITIFPSDVCNYRCKMCHIWGETGWGLKQPQKVIDEQLDINVLKRFIEEILAVNKKFNVILTGGEPLLYKHFEELVRFLRSKKLPVYLLTNGSLVRENIPLLLNNIIAMNISLDGPEEFHDSIRGQGSFKNVCENIELLVKEKKKTNKMFPYININMVVSQYNYRSAKDFLKVLRERFKDIDIILQESTNPWLKRRDLSLSFSPVIFTTRERGNRYAAMMKEKLGCDVTPAWEGVAEDSLEIDAAILKKELEELWNDEGVDYSNFIGLDDYFYNIDNLFGRSKCLAPFHELGIRRTGDAYPCVDLPDYAFGNIYKSSFKEIWESDKANCFREMIKEQNLPVCNRCCRIFADKESF